MAVAGATSSSHSALAASSDHAIPTPFVDTTHDQENPAPANNPTPAELLLTAATQGPGAALQQIEKSSCCCNGKCCCGIGLTRLNQITSIAFLILGVGCFFLMGYGIIPSSTWGYLACGIIIFESLKASIYAGRNITLGEMNTQIQRLTHDADVLTGEVNRLDPIVKAAAETEKKLQTDLEGQRTAFAAQQAAQQTSFDQQIASMRETASRQLSDQKTQFDTEQAAERANFERQMASVQQAASRQLSDQKAQFDAQQAAEQAQFQSENRALQDRIADLTSANARFQSEITDLGLLVQSGRDIMDKLSKGQQIGDEQLKEGARLLELHQQLIKAQEDLQEQWKQAEAAIQEKWGQVEGREEAIVNHMTEQLEQQKQLLTELEAVKNQSQISSERRGVLAINLLWLELKLKHANEILRILGMEHSDDVEQATTEVLQQHKQHIAELKKTLAADAATKATSPAPAASAAAAAAPASHQTTRPTATTSPLLPSASHGSAGLPPRARPPAGSASITLTPFSDNAHKTLAALHAKVTHTATAPAAGATRAPPPISLATASAVAASATSIAAPAAAASASAAPLISLAAPAASGKGTSETT